jgi:hypothetical protein
MRIAFDLEAPGLASYRWGSLYTHFTWFATPTKDLVHEFARMLGANTAPWKNAVEFRATLSFLHEIVHYLQDVGTGVGHWDYLIRQHYIPEILQKSRAASWASPDQRYPSLEALRVASEMHEKLLFVPFRHMSQNRVREMVGRICALEEGTKITVDNEIDVSVEAMLESEAAWLAVEQVLGLGGSDEQLEVLTSEKSLFDLRSMGRQYWAPRDTIHHELLGFAGDDNSFDKMRFSNAALAMLVDIACAHPSPELLKKKELDLVDCAPPVRFIRMVKAIYAADQKDGDELGAAIAARDFGKLEEVLLRKCPVRYPRSDEVYEDWKAHLSTFRSKDETVSLRITSCDRRLEAPERAGLKNLDSLLLGGEARGLPIFLQTDGGLLTLFFAWRHLPGSDVEQRLRGDMAVHDRDMRLAELATDGEAFRCPLAEMRRCHVVEPRCLAGMKDLDLLPSSKECLVRQVLTDSGWLLQGGGDG